MSAINIAFQNKGSPNRIPFFFYSNLSSVNLNTMQNQLAKIKILLAEDNSTERELFKRAMKDLSFKVELTTVEDGAKLMSHLNNVKHLPDLLFLDLNMPMKNGSERLSAIKQHPKYKHIPVIIYSTSYLDEVLDVLYSHGAHYYLQKKINNDDLATNLEHLGTMFINEKLDRPHRNKFFLK